MWCAGWTSRALGAGPRGDSHRGTPCRVSRLTEALNDSARVSSALVPTVPIDWVTPGSCRVSRNPWMRNEIRGHSETSAREAAGYWFGGFEGVLDEFGTHERSDRPPHQPAGEAVDQRRQVQELVVGPRQVRDVADVLGVRCISGEITVQQALCRCQPARESCCDVGGAVTAGGYRTCARPGRFVVIDPLRRGVLRIYRLAFGSREFAPGRFQAVNDEYS